MNEREKVKSKPSPFSRIYKVDASSRVAVYDIVGGHNGLTDAYKVLRSHRPPSSIIILGLRPVSSVPL